MLLLLSALAQAAALPGPGQGDLVLGAWVPLDQTFTSAQVPAFDLIGGVRFGLTERLSVAFPAVFRFHAVTQGGADLVLVGGISALGWSSASGLSHSYTAGVEGHWSLEWADAVAWADVGLAAIPRVQSDGFDAVSSWSLGVAPVFALGARWRFAVPLALTGTVGDPAQAISVGMVDRRTWSWRTPSTFGGVPQPTVAYWPSGRWSIEGHLGATWRSGILTTQQFLAVGHHW